MKVCRVRKEGFGDFYCPRTCRPGGPHTRTPQIPIIRALEAAGSLFSQGLVSVLNIILEKTVFSAVKKNSELFTIKAKKANLSLSMTRWNVRQSGVQVHSLLISGTDGGEWSTSRPGHVNPGKERRGPIK
jgi:hypothetical protein